MGGMGGMPGMGGMGMGSGGASEDETQARYGLDNNSFRNFMQKTIFGLQNRCKEQRIRLPKIDDFGPSATRYANRNRFAEFKALNHSTRKPLRKPFSH